MYKKYERNRKIIFYTLDVLKITNFIVRRLPFEIFT